MKTLIGIEICNRERGVKTGTEGELKPTGEIPWGGGYSLQRTRKIRGRSSTPKKEVTYIKPGKGIRKPDSKPEAEAQRLLENPRKKNRKKRFWCSNLG